MAPTCGTRDDLHHDPVDLLMPELELLQELERELLRLLDLGQGLSHGLVVLTLVVDRVRQDQAQVQLGLFRVRGGGHLGTLEQSNGKVSLSRGREVAN